MPIFIRAAACALPLVLLTPFAGAAVSINEFHYDNAGTDTGEAIELTGDSAGALSGYSLVLYNGNGGGSYRTIDLSGDMTYRAACDAYFAVVETEGLQNGSPDGMALVDSSGAVVEFLSYEGALVATDGVAAGLTSMDVGVAETGSTPVGESLQFIEGEWQGPLAESFGNCNGEGSVPDPEPTAMLISAVQGAGAEVTTEQPVTLQAIVTATYLGATGLGGFFIQEEPADQDGDPATSEGIFVYCPSCADLARGDLVEVSGNPSDYFGMSQITALAADVEVLASDQQLPPVTYLSLPAPTAGDETTLADVDAYFEAYEGMLITVGETLTVTELFNLGRYGEVVVAADGRLRQFTDAFAPDAAALARYQVEIRARRLVLDDGSDDQNPEPLPYPRPTLTNANPLRGGDQITGLSGVLNYGFDDWRVQPVFEAYSYEFVNANPRPETLMPAAGVRVASVNVLNYFPTLDTGSGGCGPLGEQDCRGANTPDELARQEAKLVEALCGLDADVIGLMEIENDGEALQRLVDLVNESCGTYQPVTTGPLGSDAITVALMYRPGAVQLTGNPAVLDTAAFVNPFAADTDRNRPALAQSFVASASDTVFTVVVNHLKSKGSGCGAGDDDTSTGQGNCNATRTAAAQAEIAWLAADPTEVESAYTLVIGDLNAYRFEDPIRAFIDAGYVDLVDAQLGEEAYSYVFDGQWGYLDHALATAALVPFVSQVQEWHINADESLLFDYNEEFKPANYADFLYGADPYRASDHDPVVVDLEFPVSAPSLEGVVALYYAGLADGTIEGRGRFTLLQLLNRSLFEAALVQADALFRRERSRAACALLTVAGRRSDGASNPPDWIEGAGVATLNGAIEAFSEANCQ